MNNFFSAAMRKATRLTRDQKLVEATKIIQRALWGRDGEAANDPAPEDVWQIELKAEPTPGLTAVEEPTEVVRAKSAATSETPVEPPDAPTRPAPKAVWKRHRPDHRKFGFDPVAPLVKFRKAPAVITPDGASYLTRSFACEAGARDYTLYIPSRLGESRPALLVMLHGCTQNPDDFAIGTGMNRLAEKHGFIVAYPKQARNANQMNCWNWFDPKDQTRERGEPRLIAGLTRAIIADFNIDADRVFVAGISAGGAMAEIMGVTYPELYAAVGVHSGLAYGSATDMASAFATMSGARAAAPVQEPGRTNGRKTGVRTIIFHGTSDRTVHPANARAILDEARASLAGPLQETQIDGCAGGKVYTRTIIADAQGVAQVEHWAIDGLGHAWSGGDPEGSYTEPHGPDASREMLRFFLTEESW